MQEQPEREQVKTYVLEKHKIQAAFWKKFYQEIIKEEDLRIAKA